MTQRVTGAKISGDSMTYNLREIDIQYHLHPQTDAVRHERRGPLVVTEGDGCYFIDMSGKRYLDMHSGLWCSSLGSTQPRLVRAAVRQMERLPYAPSFRHKAAEPAIRLAEKLIQLAPVPMSKVMFQCSGSEANDTAVKIVWYYWNALGQPKRRKIISRSCSFHGTTVTGSSMSGLETGHAGFGLPLPGFIHIAHPDVYRGLMEHETQEDYATRLANEFERTIQKEGPDTVAAFIAEPVIGGGGLYPPPPTYFEKIEAVARKYDILIIADEVICGFGRTGEWWGSATYHLRPDIITCAKALSAAFLPISAVMINEKIYNVVREQSHAKGGFGHGYTYGGHAVCAAVALEVLNIYEEMEVLTVVRERGGYLRRRLDAFRNHPNVGDIRGVGLMWGAEIVEDKASKKRFDKASGRIDALTDHCLDAGLNIRALAGHTLAFTPPFVISEGEIDRAIDVFASALSTLSVQAG